MDKKTIGEILLDNLEYAIEEGDHVLNELKLIVFNSSDYSRVIQSSKNEYVKDFEFLTSTYKGVKCISSNQVQRGDFIII